MKEAVTFMLLLAIVAGSFILDDFEIVNGREVRMEPATVPEPVDGSRWWYTPSRKAHLFRHRYPSGNAFQSRASDLRLPGDLQPTLYNVRLLPFIEVGNWTTDGFVEIFFNCITNTNNIVLHSAELTIDRASIVVIQTTTGSSLTVTGLIDEQNTRNFITIQLAEELQSGERYKVSMKFISILNNQLRGFYRSSYVENGVTKYLAVTQFEATDARRSFPCFDEPTMKANFSVTLGRKSSWTSTSNMPLLGTNPIDGLAGYVWDFYETSVRMSSYLVAAVVSEFIGIPSDPGLSKVLFRIWARPDASNITDYGRNLGPRILDYYERYFGIDYPLPKQDMAAIPDFAAGAMENWGLITYRESDLLIDPATASAGQIQRVAIVIAHELAHQWFGDLVTMEWWDDLWLNEGFASYMEYIGTDSVEPTFKMNEQFIVENLQYVFGPDGLETSHPLIQQVETPAEIDGLFDAISYEKGSCVIRMMSDIIGDATFVRGLTRYLNNKAYVNANHNDLWQALQDQANAEGVVLPASVKEIMDTWSTQMGYPYVTITRDYQTGGALATQERFLSRKSNDSTDTHVYSWWVPLTYTSDITRPKSRQWLSKDQPNRILSNLGANASQWVIFNVNQANYYRVKYDTANYNLIRDQLLADHTRISDNNRAQLLDDSLNLALANLLPYAQALDMTRYLKNDFEYVPWDAAYDELNYIENMLYNKTEYTKWKAYFSSLVTPFYNFVGFQEMPTDAHLTIYARSDAMYFACIKVEVPGCVQGSRNQYAALMAQPDNTRIVSVNQRTTVLRTAVANGGQAEYDFAFAQYKAKNDLDFLRAMSSSKQPDTLNSLLGMLLDPNSGIRVADYNTVFNYVSSTPYGNEIALDFLINRWNELQSSAALVYLPTWYRYVCNRQNTVEGYAKLVKLRDDHPAVLGNSASVRQGLEVVQNNINWLTLHQAEIGSWLNTVSLN